MATPSILTGVRTLSSVRRRARTMMALILAVTGALVIARALTSVSISLGLVAGLLVLACLALCVFTALYDEHTWRGVERELERLRDRTSTAR